MELDALITDLALILIVAGVVTLLFKKLKQPVVLGYIVAGFLVGPNFVFFPTIVDEGDINLWAELGIIVLLFSLGLEFSFKKLFQVGASAVLTALVIVLGMMLAGYGAGRLLHFTYLDSIFLGAMLSMSSTTIIIKAFTDLNLRKKAFTNLVFGVLIVEDLFAVVMMVILSSIAVKNSFEGAELLESIAKLVFFLIIWFVVGISILPLILSGYGRFGYLCRIFFGFGRFCHGIYISRYERSRTDRESRSTGKGPVWSHIFRIGRYVGQPGVSQSICIAYLFALYCCYCRTDILRYGGYVGFGTDFENIDTIGV